MPSRPKPRAPAPAAQGGPGPRGIDPARFRRLLGLPPAARASGNGELQRRADGLQRYRVGPAATFEEDGRLMLIALVRRGLRPDSIVVDVGCGALRAGYWLIHFLDPGRYHGIEPATHVLEAARTVLLEPGLEERKQPRFDDSSSFDLGVFGVRPDFVLMRSIWSHASKPQVLAMLDSFRAVAGPDSLLLTSYLPARTPPLNARLRARLERRGWLGGHDGSPWWYLRRLRRDYRRDAWAAELIAHRPEWVRDQCRRRGLDVRESAEDGFGIQVWLEIRPALEG